MTKFISIVSSKGGTGKTTIALNLSLALSKLGKDSVVVDANFSNPNISLYLGSPFLEPNIKQAIYGDTSIRQAAYQHESGLRFIPGNMKLENFSPILLSQTLLDLEGSCDVAIFDTSPNLDNYLSETLKHTDYVILVTTPDLIAMTESLRTINYIRSQKKEILGIIVNKKTSNKVDYDEKNIELFLNCPILGTIPYDEKIRIATRKSTPILFSHPNSKFSQSIKEIAAVLTGKNQEIRKKNIIDKIFNI